MSLNMYHRTFFFFFKFEIRKAMELNNLVEKTFLCGSDLLWHWLLFFFQVPKQMDWTFRGRLCKQAQSPTHTHRPCSNRYNLFLWAHTLICGLWHGWKSYRNLKMSPGPLSESQNCHCLDLCVSLSCFRVTAEAFQLMSCIVVYSKIMCEICRNSED